MTAKSPIQYEPNFIFQTKAKEEERQGLQTVNLSGNDENEQDHSGKLSRNRAGQEISKRNEPEISNQSEYPRGATSGSSTISEPRSDVNKETKRKSNNIQSRDFWKEAITEKFGTGNWLRKKQIAFDKDQFDPNQHTPCTWLNKQVKRLKASNPPQGTNREINNKLLFLCHQEIQWAVKSMIELHQEPSDLIQALKEVVNNTKFCKRKSFKTEFKSEKYRSDQNYDKYKSDFKTDKNKDNKKPLDKTKDEKAINCYSCGKSGHTSRNCPKNKKFDNEEETHSEEIDIEESLQNDNSSDFSINIISCIKVTEIQFQPEISNIANIN
ncbi:hypothetical protein PPACK8108_LOCUS3569 [Phakopsora pachyrhizi]|uniref:CCHC-type domain-containing protein n=1 Tax=Phakopsora pachyrhizi TaxID=170000 RepID=A0AAV0AMZ8_PHAPC|nr:hypothetical protein PPACK8108_LOCUS3569 [Phakopsora pachyrhizi]